MATYKVTMDNGMAWLMAANMSQSAAPLAANFHFAEDGDDGWQSTPYQVADSSHLLHRAAQMAYDYFCVEPGDESNVIDVEVN